MRRRSRMAARVAVLLLAGAAISIGLAWACVARAGLVDCVVVDPRSVESWPRWVPDDWPPWPGGAGRSSRAILAELHDFADFGASLRTQTLQVSPGTVDGPPELVAEHMRADAMLRGRRRVLCLAAGWPMPCLVAEWGWVDRRSGSDEVRAPGLRGGWHIGPEFGSEWPLLPLWPGFAIDMLLFGAAMGLPWLALASWKRLRRARGGRRLACGYELRGLASGSPCPECGRSAVTVRAAQEHWSCPKAGKVTRTAAARRSYRSNSLQRARRLRRGASVGTGPRRSRSSGTA